MRRFATRKLEGEKVKKPSCDMELGTFILQDIYE